MVSKLNSLSKSSKVFIVLSAALVLVPLLSYTYNVAYALSMDKASYNCTSDSMMMQLCHNPLGASAAWAVLYTGVFGTPLLLAWLATGVGIVLRSKIDDKR